MRHGRHLLAFVMLAAAALAGCVPAPTAPPMAAEGGATPAGEMQSLALPAPRRQGPLSLEEALAQRRSVRSFADRRLTPGELGQLLWAAQGITGPAGQRTAPSAGATYPLEVYAVTPDAVYRYEAQGGRLLPQVAGDVRPALAAAAVGQSAVAAAPAVIVLTGVYGRTAQRYGEERGRRYVHLEAGHAAQNVLLQAVALGLGAVPIGAFDDGQVRRLLDLPADQQPLYLIPAGQPD